MTYKLKVLDLFSGGGGFSLGLERTGGFETVAFCEIEKFPQAVLRKKWPLIPIYPDVRELNNARLIADGITQINIITGGFPCQDLSGAGKRAGIDAERSGLWSECARLVGEIRPDYAIFENVTDLLNGPSERPGAWFSRVLTDLAKIGYDAEWHDIPASYIGAWHRRGRVWLLAYPNKKHSKCSGKAPILRQSHVQKQSTRSFTKWPGRQDLPAPTLCSSNDGIPNFRDWLMLLGNAVVPQIPEMIGHAILEAEAAA